MGSRSVRSNFRFQIIEIQHKVVETPLTVDSRKALAEGRLCIRQWQTFTLKSENLTVSSKETRTCKHYHSANEISRPYGGQMWTRIKHRSVRCGSKYGLHIGGPCRIRGKVVPQSSTLESPSTITDLVMIAHGRRRSKSLVRASIQAFLYHHAVYVEASRGTHGSRTTVDRRDRGKKKFLPGINVILSDRSC